MDEVVTQVGAFAPLIMNAVKALIVLILGWIVAGAIGGMVRRRINSTPQIDPTNNVVEQAIRVIVIDRHVTQGTRNPRGRRSKEMGKMILTVPPAKKRWHHLLPSSQRKRKMRTTCCMRQGNLIQHEQPL